MDNKHPKFTLGKIIISPYGQLRLSRASQGAEYFLNMHQKCQWGEVTKSEWKRNDEIVNRKVKRASDRILSSYTTDFEEEIIWVITTFNENKTYLISPHEFNHYISKP